MKKFCLFMIVFLSGRMLFSSAYEAQKFRMKKQPVLPLADGTIFCEAEEFAILKGFWQAKNWGENYFAATFANTFLSRKAFLSAPEQCEESIAVINVKIKNAGKYLVLARYEAPYRFETQFRIKIEQNQKIVMDRVYGSRENLKIWAFGEKLKKEVAWPWGAVENIVWEGHDAYVNLVEGTARIYLIAGRQPEPAAKRNIDILMLTKNYTEVQTRIEKEGYLPLDGLLTQENDVWIKIKNTGREKIEVKNISFPGGPFQQHSPYWVHMRNWKPVNVSVEPGETTEWIEVGSTMDTLNDGQWGFNVSGKCRIEFGVMNADGEIEKIKEFTINNPQRLNLIGYANVRYCKKIDTPDEAVSEIIKTLKKIPSYGKKPENTLIFANTDINDFIPLFGIKKDPYIYVDWRGLTASQLEEKCKGLTQEQRETIRVVSLGDEISLPSPNPKEAKEGFIDYLKNQGVKPEEIDPQRDWNKISYQVDEKTKLSNPALFYWSQKYRYRYGIKKIKELTDVLRKYLPNAYVGANFSPHHGGYKHAYLGEVFKWISCFREEGLTMPWSEDYIWQVPVGSPQMNEINLDIFRAGIRGKEKQMKIHYYVMPHWPGNTPNMWKRQFYGALAHGMKVINLFEFHPVWMAYTENHVSSVEMFAMILKSFREYGLFEDIVQDGMVRNSKTALYFSETADIWSDNEGSFAAGKRALYIAIRSNQIPLDFIIEQDVLDGTINQYKTIFLTDRHVNLACSKKIVEWVKNGGNLFLTAGAGMFDEYNRQNTVIEQMLNAKQVEIIEPQNTRIEYIKQDLPFAKPSGEIKNFLGSNENIAVYGPICKLMINDKSYVKAEFSDGNPAILSFQYGKGKVLYCAFLPSLLYFKPAIPKKPVDRGTTDDAMAHFLPVAFDSRIGDLIKSFCEEKIPVIIKQNGNFVNCIENTIIDSEKGTVVILINWSPQPFKNITVDINFDVSNKKISLASGQSIKSIKTDGLTTSILLDIDIAEAIIIR